jgi:hypothetical protein
MDSFSEIEKELRELRDTAQNTKISLRVLETSVIEKHFSVIEKIEKIASDIEKIATNNDRLVSRIEHDLIDKIALLKQELNAVKEEVEGLSDLATSSKAGLRVVWTIAGILIGAIALISGVVSDFSWIIK